MNEEIAGIYNTKKCMHPRVKKVLEELAPLSPMAVPRDSSQPRTGNILSMHNDHFIETLPIQMIRIQNSEVSLNLTSALLRRRRDKY